MSDELTAKIRLGLGELAVIRDQFNALGSRPPGTPAGVIETAAASAMLHSFYTEIEKILKLIARQWDERLPSSDSWHRDLLTQMSERTARRPALLSKELFELLGEFLAFRHLFRGASIALMRWDKLAPLIAKVGRTYDLASMAIEDFVRFVELDGESF